MRSAGTLRRARVASGFTLRELAERSGTSHSTLAAYEAGRVVPRVDTLDRILRAAGYGSDIVLRRRPDATSEERRAKGEELRQVLDLAAQFPARHDTDLSHPRFPQRLP
jgi:transcriptional regulator with XRE-family HTH domain